VREVEQLENGEELLGRIKDALVDFDVESAKEMSLDAVQRGISTVMIVDAMSKGMDVVGEKYECGEYFVPELIMAGETMKETIEVLKPFMKEDSESGLGKAVVATVAGDLHDIGKNIFINLLSLAGFKVIDLGVDVSAEKIVESVKEHNPDILGLSALLTTNLTQFPIIVRMLSKAGLRNKTKILVGGATVTEEYADEAGVDGYAKTALDGVEICKKWRKIPA
jgi:5-methyltetrahydrofolate--homocysteine methyltransferase